MKLHDLMRRLLFSAAVALSATKASAADYPSPKEGDWIAKEFKFHDGVTLANVNLHYTTIGAPTGEPVILLHGTYGSAANFLTPDFAGELFGPDQPLDASKYYLIIPDALGSGKSTKPSDGLKAKFPKYNYNDMVEAQYRLVTEGLGIKHVRLIIGNSMVGMQTWLWAKAAQSFQGSGAQLGVDCTDPRKMLGKLQRTKQLQQVGMLSMLVQASYWPKQRKHLAGYSNDQICERCGGGSLRLLFTSSGSAQPMLS
jgi:hypothetical protein